MSLGVKPDALIGHSMGENTAACLAGVFEFNDALGLVLLRGQLMDDVPKGGMLSVQLPAEEGLLTVGLQQLQDGAVVSVSVCNFSSLILFMLLVSSLFSLFSYSPAL